MVVTAPETGSGGRHVDCDCDAHLMIDSATLEQSAYGTSVKCEFSVLAATEPSQVGKVVTEFFQADGNSAWKLLNLAEAAGLVTREQRLANQKAGVGTSFDEALLKGKQVCGQVKMEMNMMKNPDPNAKDKYIANPDKPGPFAKVGPRTFHLWDKRMSHVPKDGQFASFVPKPAATVAPAATATQPAQAASSPPTQQQPQQPPLPLAGQEQSAVSMNW